MERLKAEGTLGCGSSCRGDQHARSVLLSPRSAGDGAAVQHSTCGEAERRNADFRWIQDMPPSRQICCGGIVTPVFTFVPVTALILAAVVLGTIGLGGGIYETLLVDRVWSDNPAIIHFAAAVTR